MGFTENDKVWAQDETVSVAGVTLSSTETAATPEVVEGVTSGETPSVAEELKSA